MRKMIVLYDKEDNCSLLVHLDDENSGVTVIGTDQNNKTVRLTLDDRLLKQLCNDVAKAIKNRARRNNECGEIVYA